jgi:hypothetical protein
VTKDLRRTSVSGGGSRPAPIAEEPAARPEPARQAAPAPPAHTIAREARESTSPAMPETVRGVDYGREIELPDGAARMARPAEAPVAAPAMPRMQTETFTAPMPPASASRPAVAQAPAPVAAPAPAHTAVAAVTPAPSSDGTLVVPVRIPKGATQEIVLRIVLQVEE